MNETMLPMKRKKSLTIPTLSIGCHQFPPPFQPKRKKSLATSHTQHRTLPIPTPFSTKEKEWGRDKKRRPTPRVREVNKKKYIIINISYY